MPLDWSSLFMLIAFYKRAAIYMFLKDCIRIKSEGNSIWYTSLNRWGIMVWLRFIERFFVITVLTLVRFIVCIWVHWMVCICKKMHWVLCLLTLVCLQMYYQKRSGFSLCVMHNIRKGPGELLIKFKASINRWILIF